MFTLDEIRAAYAATGHRPGWGHYFSAGNCACPEAALIRHRHGAAGVARLEAAPTVEAVAELLGVAPAEAASFAAGFDDVPASATGPDFDPIAYELGREARRALRPARLDWLSGARPR
jgi:hypothetical protein